MLGIRHPLMNLSAFTEPLVSSYSNIPSDVMADILVNMR